MGRKDHVDRDPFTALKWAGAVAMLAGLAWMAANADVVLDAYRSDDTVEALNLRPLTFSAATIPPGDDGALALALAPDTSEEDVEPVTAGEPEVTEPVISGGTARLSGRVTGLDVDDAGEVRLTRVTDGGRRQRTVPVAGDRTWIAEDLPGGRYRVRALVPGLRASQGSLVVFIADGEHRRLDLGVTTPPERLEFEVLGPETMTLDVPAVVAITAGKQEVDADGRSVLVPVDGATLSASFSPVVALLSSNAVVTDGGGAARFLLSCEATGQAAVTFTAGDPAAGNPAAEDPGAEDSGAEDSATANQVAVMTLPPCVATPPEGS